MLPLLMAAVVVAAADTSAAAVAADTLAVVAAAALHISVVAVHTSVVDALGLDRLRLGMDEAHPLWLGADRDGAHVSRLDLAPVHLSMVDTADISGTAVGGITALARAGYGRTITASTCGPVISPATMAA